MPTHYGVRLHRQYQGEWEHNLTWKPSQVFSITAGWLRVIHTGHRRLLRGGAIILPILVRHSNRLVKRKNQSKEYFCADDVLKVQDIEILAPMLDTRVTVTAIAGGTHDLVLSRLPAREQVDEKISTWLTSTFG